MASLDDPVLDSPEQYQKLEFLHVFPKDHIMGPLSETIAYATYIPRHTVFLVGLAVVSAISCRKFRVEYRDGSTLPISLYVCAEQPSGAAKSRVLGVFQKPFFEAEKETKLELSKQLENPELKDGRKEIEKQLSSYYFTTNLTPEAIDAILTESGGYFAGVSAEQGLFNTLFGASYGGSDRASNNDAVLQGFGGEWYNARRAGRNCYRGNIVGALAMFAQEQGIKLLLDKSNGTGLAERFLLIAEEHYLGRRDFSVTRVMDQDVLNQYDERAKWIESHSGADLTICADGWHAITECKQGIEPYLANGGAYAPNATIRGMFSKIDMQIMKVAANLHLLSGNYLEREINLPTVQLSIYIVHHLLRGALNICGAKKVIGQSAEYTSILSLFEKSNAPRPLRAIKTYKIQTLPFKDYTGNKSKAVENAVHEMVLRGILEEVWNREKQPPEFRGYRMR